MPTHRRPPDCEYTAPGSETEAMDCWEPATKRHVNSDDVTVGLFCKKHSGKVRGLFHRVQNMNDPTS